LQPLLRAPGPRRHGSGLGNRRARKAPWVRIPPRRSTVRSGGAALTQHRRRRPLCDRPPDSVPCRREVARVDHGLCRAADDDDHHPEQRGEAERIAARQPSLYLNRVAPGAARRASAVRWPLRTAVWQRNRVSGVGREDDLVLQFLKPLQKQTRPQSSHELVSFRNVLRALASPLFVQRRSRRTWLAHPCHLQFLSVCQFPAVPRRSASSRSQSKSEAGESQWPRPVIRAKQSHR